jgi:hypothetical protein
MSLSSRLKSGDVLDWGPWPGVIPLVWVGINYYGIIFSLIEKKGGGWGVTWGGIID